MSCKITVSLLLSGSPRWGIISANGRRTQTNDVAESSGIIPWRHYHRDGGVELGDHVWLDTFNNSDFPERAFKFSITPELYGTQPKTQTILLPEGFDFIEILVDGGCSYVEEFTYLTCAYVDPGDHWYPPGPVKKPKQQLSYNDQNVLIS